MDSMVYDNCLAVAAGIICKKLCTEISTLVVVKVVLIQNGNIIYCFEYSNERMAEKNTYSDIFLCLVSLVFFL